MNIPRLKIVLSEKIKASERKSINNEYDAHDLCRSLYDKDTLELYESFYAIYLNRRNKVLGYELISFGSTHAAFVCPRKVLTPAILCNAVAVIITHNHPSGNTAPSTEDTQVTNKLKEACKLFDITLLDHIIITEESYVSMSSWGLI